MKLFIAQIPPFCFKLVQKLTFKVNTEKQKVKGFDIIMR